MSPLSSLPISTHFIVREGAGRLTGPSHHPN